MAIGLAFVDIVGDTSRTEQQVERDMNRVLAVVEEALDPVDIQAAVDAGTEQDLVRELNQDIRAAQAAISAINVDVRLDPETRQRLTEGLKTAIAQTRARADEIKVRVDNRAVVEEVIVAVEEAQAAAPTIEIETRVDRDRLAQVGKILSGVGSAAASAIGPVSILAAGIGAVGLGAEGLLAVVTTIEQIAPAAALAAPAILSVGLAIGTVKLATSGVGDAIKAAFDPSDPKKFAESLKGLSPEAARFVSALHDMQPALKQLQLDVQDRFFKGFADTLGGLSSAVLPQVRGALLNVAGTFNTMATGAAAAAAGLGPTGVLGKALGFATDSLAALKNLPGLAVTAFGELAAAAGPSLQQLADQAAKAGQSISGKLTKAFESGGLQNAIEDAIGQIKVLFDVLGNVGTIFNNITASAAGFNGPLSVLKGITDQIAKVTATDAAQKAFAALFQAVNLLVSTALPLLGQALAALGPIIIALQPGVTALIDALGPALSQVIAALGPVLTSLATALSAAAVAFAPILTLAGQLISAILPVLNPLFGLLTTTFQQLAPIIAQVASILASVLVPILTSLSTSVLTPLVAIFGVLVKNLLPILGQLVQALAPALISLSGSFVQIFTALSPLLVAFGQLIGGALQILLPLLTPLIETIGQLAAIFADELANVISTVVVPAVLIITDLLKGDFRGAFDNAKLFIVGFVNEVIRVFLLLPVKIFDALVSLGGKLLSAFGNAFQQLNIAIGQHFSGIVNFFANLPQTILVALGNLNNLLINAGRDIINGLISGIKNKLDDLKSVLSSVTNFIKDHKGPESVDRSLLTPAGQQIMDSLMGGIQSRLPALAGQLGAITAMVGATQPSMGVSVGVGGVPLGPSAASRFASPTAPTGTGTGGATNVQVFIGTREITDIVDVRVAQANRIQARQLVNGTRR
jgi:phage-related protein